MPKTMFKKQLLASSVAMVVASGANAQNQAIQEEELVVTGIRASVQRAMDLKRDAQGVVDAISAEDIGKFPDTNLAESLQRITGVSIDRANGEGSKVTVRGLGPDFNLVTLNGRQMPVSNLEDTNASTSRSFDFANLASESVSGVEVYKTSRAEIPTGGMGATINIKTLRPFDKPGMTASIGVKGVMDSSSDEGASITPEISGIYSNTFADDTFGVSLTLSVQERESGNKQANIAGWRTFDGTVNQDWGAGTAEWGGIPDTGHVNRPGPTDIYSVPQALAYSLHETQRTRTNGQLVFQFAPNEDITATLDYTMSTLETAAQYNEFSAWFNFGVSTGEWTDGPISSALVYTEPMSPPGDYSMAAGDNARKTDNTSIGLNVEWQATDTLSFEFDAHSSSAESGADGPFGTHNNISAASWIRSETTAYFDQDFPVLQLTYPAGQTSIQPGDMRVTGSSFRNAMMEMDITQVQIKGRFEFDEGDSILFGVSSTGVDYRSAYANVQRDAWGGVGAAGDFDDSFWPLDTVADKFDLPGSDNPNLINEFVDFDFATVRARAEELYATNTLADNGDCGTGFCPSTNFEGQTDRRTQEDALSAFFQVNISTELGEMPVNMAAGIRYETTDVASQAAVPTYSQANWVSANEISLVATGAQDFTSLEGGYDNVLPSFDIDIEIIEDVKLRSSFSQTMARPGYGAIQGGLTVGQLARIDGGTGNAGNPSLLPYESRNFDLSTEWYFDDASYASIGYFRKDVSNYIGFTVMEDQVVFDNLLNPSQGPRAAAAGNVNDSNVVRQYIVDNFTDGVTVNPAVPDATDDIITGIAGDPVLLFDVTVPVNEQAARIEGFELAVQHVFGDTGFGVIANYTTAHADVAYDDMDHDGSQFIVPGLSDSANLVGFYDKNGIQVRLAYNWRDEFIQSDQQAQEPGPVYVEAYGQFDINASYEVMDGLSVFVEGINITDEYTRTHGRAKEQILNITQTGARYNIGARYTF